jgi:hypothetical protein
MHRAWRTSCAGRAVECGDSLDVPKSLSFIRPISPRFFWLVSVMIDPLKNPFFGCVVVLTPFSAISPLMAAFFPMVSTAVYASIQLCCHVHWARVAIRPFTQVTSMNSPSFRVIFALSELPRSSSRTWRCVTLTNNSTI